MTDKSDVILDLLGRMDEKLDGLTAKSFDHGARIAALESRPNLGSLGFWRTALALLLVVVVGAAIVRLTMPESTARAIVDHAQVGN